MLDRCSILIYIKKEVSHILRIKISLATATALIAAGPLYYFITLALYEPSEDLYHFPVPTHAKLVGENEPGHQYDWSRASEENGIFYGYEMVLKANGWEKGEREGASVYYTKGDHTIDLMSASKHLEILKVD
ncbi:hypothetical protein [Rossellomorea marisflavi]|uniref:hypothetical protein n=1 Tax=Rossellomorea marisflavi TaxID=189381 RepID=UPI00345893DA